jgi:hypothetical protein
VSHFLHDLAIDHYYVNDIDGHEKQWNIDNREQTCIIAQMRHSGMFYVAMASEAEAYNKNKAARRSRFALATKLWKDVVREAQKKRIYRSVWEYIDLVAAVRQKFASMLTNPENHTGGIALCICPAHHYAKFGEKRTPDELWQMRGGRDEDLGELQFPGKGKGYPKGKGKSEKGKGKTVAKGGKKGK